MIITTENLVMNEKLQAENNVIFEILDSIDTNKLIVMDKFQCSCHPTCFSPFPAINRA